MLFLLLVFLIFLVFLRRKRIVLRDDGGPTNLEREDELEGEGGLVGVEQRWMESVEETTRAGYLRGKGALALVHLLKIWQSQYPPNSLPTDITLSQFLSIQEKGVSAWSFEPDYESNPALIVQSRTEITFLADGVGMAEEEGGGCCVQSNLPLPKLNEVYYWECKFYEKPEATVVSIGLATKPFPSFRLPGSSKYSVGYFSSDGFKAHSYPFTSQSYGPPLKEGDVLGVGYRPRTGTVFFTRNGKKLEDAFVGLNKHNLFPTVGANSACTIHVNLGQAGFVFIEANVKKWGLAPMMGTLAPPPAYGSERGSILLESAGMVGTSPSPRGPLSPPPRSSTDHHHDSRSTRRPPPASSRHKNRRRDPPATTTSTATSPAGAVSALGTPSASQPIRPSPLRHSRQVSSISAQSTTSTSTLETGAGSDDDDVQNPPTPGLFDVSLHSLHRFPQEVHSDDEAEADARTSGSSSGNQSPASSEEEMGIAGPRPPTPRPPFSANSSFSPADPGALPPAYFPVDPNMYPAGVAELMLADVFASNPSGRQLPANVAAFQNFANNSGFSEGRYEAIGGTTAGSTPTDSSTTGWLSWLSGRGSGRGAPSETSPPPPTRTSDNSPV
ncbi:Ran-binding protein 9/10, partial [Phenoliferia sp. Uapishka_3]